MSIRTRLLLLVFAVWLPAVIGFGLLARTTYQREEDSARMNVQNIGQSLNFVAERELDKRAVMARTLAGSSALHDGDLRRFREEAAVAVEGSGNWAFLVDRERVLLNTLLPELDLTPRPRPPGAHFVTGEPEVFFAQQAPLLKKPVLGVFAAQRGVQPPQYNVGVSFEPSVMQAILDEHRYPEGSVASIIDQDQHVIARSRDPEKWLGRQATGDIQRRAQAGEDGFAESTTLDGVPSLSYLSKPSRYRWAVIIALPRTALTRAAQRVTLQAMAASGLLLLIGLGMAMYGARRISAPVLALREAASQLGEDAVPPRLSTGVSEADQVSAALHEAGLRSHEATRTLEQRVAEAVQQAGEAQARLLDGQKHEAIGRLTGGLAHDFNNLLQTIQMALQVMDRQVGEGSQRRVLQSALRATAKAAALVRQMLTFGRRQALQPQSVDLGDFVLKTQELTSKAVGARVQLSAHIEPRLPALFVDPTQLELALLNLVFNARDAMPDGGHITLTGRLAEPAETAGLQTGRRYLCIEVADDGPGMDAETQAKAFEPYFTTKPVGTGSGLGLPQVLALARQSGGDARLQSKPGEGTRVSLYLPASEQRAEAPAASAGAPQPSRQLRLLMVEDDPLVASVVLPALQGEGHKVTLCNSADEALQRLLQGQPFDVLFTDVVMPGRMSGLDLVAWCREHLPALPTVVATGYSAQAPDTHAQLLRKPYAIDTLLSALQQAADDKKTPPAAE